MAATTSWQTSSFQPSARSDSIEELREAVGLAEKTARVALMMVRVDSDRRRTSSVRESSARTESNGEREGFEVDVAKVVGQPRNSSALGTARKSALIATMKATHDQGRQGA